jgi:hypothetical protein
MFGQIHTSSLSLNMRIYSFILFLETMNMFKKYVLTFPNLEILVTEDLFQVYFPRVWIAILKMMAQSV